MPTAALTCRPCWPSMPEIGSGHSKGPMGKPLHRRFLHPVSPRSQRLSWRLRPLTPASRFVHDKGKTIYDHKDKREMPRNRKTITLSLPPEMDQQLRQVVEEEGRTVSELLREAFRLYLEEREWRRQERMQMRRSRQSEQEDTRRSNR